MLQEETMQEVLAATLAGCADQDDGPRALGVDRKTSSVKQVRRALRPWRTEAHWATMATVRYETGPGELYRPQWKHRECAMETL
jgi:hypothetical protein